MIARIEIDQSNKVYAYRVLEDSAVLYDDGGFSSVLACLAAAVEGLPPQVRAVEVACGGIVSGTYPLDVLAINPAPVAEHAVNTTAAVYEAMKG